MSAIEEYKQRAKQTSGRVNASMITASSAQVAGFLEALEGRGMRARLAKSLSKHLTPELMIASVGTAMRRNPKLLECEPSTVIASIVTAAQLGLTVDGVMGQAYLVPYKKECTLQIGYRGLAVLAYRSGMVKGVAAEVVYENDIFEFEYGTEQRLRHIPHVGGDRGANVCVWAKVDTPHGCVFRVLTFDDVQKAKESSQSANSTHSPWSSHPVEMWRKTALRSVLKLAPMAPEAQSAATVDEGLDFGYVSRDDAIDATAEVIDSAPDLPKSDRQRELDEIADEAFRESTPGLEG